MAPPGTVPHVVTTRPERGGRLPLGPGHPDTPHAGGLRHAVAGHCQDGSGGPAARLVPCARTAFGVDRTARPCAGAGWPE